MATSGGNFVSIAHLEIPLLIKMLMCQILIFPAVCDPDHKTSHRLHGVFVAIANNTLYGSKLQIFILCQKSKIMFYEDIY